MHVVATHGGAGHHPAGEERLIIKAMKQACTFGTSSTIGADALVERAINTLEANDAFNAGYGSNLTMKGTVECDASIMDDSGCFGSVGALAGVRYPISAAREVLIASRTPNVDGRVHPILLVSSGAYDFAKEKLALSQFAPSEDLVSVRATSEWRHWRRRLKIDAEGSPVSERNDQYGVPREDTVGAVSLIEVDGHAKLAAGVSSGGLLLKHSGRVGEAAVFGAGCWASPNVAVSVSGTGEQIIRAGLARRLGEAVQKCCDDKQVEKVHEAIHGIMDAEFLAPLRIRNDLPANSGAIVLAMEEDEWDTTVRLYCVFTTESMAISYASDTLKPKAQVLRQEKHPNGIFLTAFTLSKFPPIDSQ